MPQKDSIKIHFQVMYFEYDIVGCQNMINRIGKLIGILVLTNIRLNIT